MSILTTRAWKPDEGARIAQLVPDGEFYLVSNAGHFLQEDAGEEVARQMIRSMEERNNRCGKRGQRNQKSVKSTFR